MATRTAVDRPRRGRGAVRNVRSRFDAWEVVETPDESGYDAAEPLRTQVQRIRAKTVIRRNDSPDVAFDQSINPYQGCEHGCVYCFARPTHAFWDLSPGLDFESKILVKENAVEVLRSELRSRSYRCKPIVLGANTDAYQPVEKRLELTRGLVKVLVESRHPLSVVTKSSLVLRDIDLLAPHARSGRAAVFVSITTLDPRLARKMEPRAASPQRRLETVRQLNAAGVPVGVMASPMIPGLNDHELESILEAGAKAGASYASTILLRLPHELKQIFDDWLEEHFPDRAGKVTNHLRSMRGGKLYDAQFGRRMRGVGPMADLLSRRFEIAARRFGLSRTVRPLDTDAFEPPIAPGDQRSLF